MLPCTPPCTLPRTYTPTHIPYVHACTHARRLTERQFHRLASDQGYDANAGLGLGDVRILMRAVAKSGILGGEQYITYDGAVEVCR